MIAFETTPVAVSSLSWLREVGNAVLDLLFPPRCVECHHLGAWLCSTCLAMIPSIQPPICQKCGLPLGVLASAGLSTDDGPGSTCDRCQRDPPRMDALRAAAFYAGPLRQAIQQFKYEDLRALAPALGRVMAGAWAGLAPAGPGMDVIVPVPLHVRRERERGYNQASLLASELGLGLGIPVAGAVLVRSRETAPQVGLDHEQRRANVEGAFQCLNASLTGRRVLLVDDVFTTGATLEAAAGALRDGGAAQVCGYALARAT